MSGPAWSGRMSFKARLLLVLILGGVGAIVSYAAFGRGGDEDEPQISHVATAADYGSGMRASQARECDTYLITPRSGHTDVHRRVSPDAHAPSLGTLPSNTVVGSREIRDGYVRLAQPLIGWVAMEELTEHCP